MIVTYSYNRQKYLELCHILANTANELGDALRGDLPQEMKTQFEPLKTSIQVTLSKLEEIEQLLSDQMDKKEHK